MSTINLLLPVFVQVALTLGLLVGMGRARLTAVARGEVRVPDIALGQRAWPAQPTKLANSYHNQFELPVLFYVLVACLIAARDVMMLDVVLAWLFVSLRLVHAYIHVTSNHVMYRFAAFVAGVGVLVVMWLVFGITMFAAGEE